MSSVTLERPSLAGAMFSLSSFVIGPALAGGGDPNPPAVEQPDGGHASHH